MRYQFNQVFKDNGNNTYSPLRPIRVGGVSLGEGVFFGPGVSFGGVDFFMYKGHELEASEEDGILVITAIY